MDWFLYDRDLSHERVKKTKLTCHDKLIGKISKSFQWGIVILELYRQR